MQFKKLFLLFTASVVIIGIFGFSIWYRWNTDQKLAQQRIPELTPSAEFNHGAPWVRDVAISPINPNLVASVGERNVIKVWDRNSPNAPMLTLTDHPGKDGNDPSRLGYIAFSPTGEWLASTDFWNLAFWDVSSGKQINTFEIAAGAAAISPDGHLLATTSNDVKLWDIRNPKDIKEIIVLPRKMGEQPLTHEEAWSTRYHIEIINQHYGLIDFSSDGKWIAAAGQIYEKDSEIWRDIVKVWDLEHKQLIKILPRKGHKPNYGSAIRSIKFSPDNRFFTVAGTDGLTIWTVREWHIYHNVQDQQHISDLAFSPDSKMYALADPLAITLWSVDSVTPIASLKGPEFLSSIYVIAFSQDGSTLVGGRTDGIVRLWDIGGVNEK